MKRSSAMIKNVVFGFGSQFIILIMGIIVPRIMIKGYGSDVNGLLSTITQIFTYMALLEAGIGQAARNALYRPIVDRDRGAISQVSSLAQLYYRKIALYYVSGVVLLSVLCPFIIRTNVDRVTVSAVVFFEGISGALSFYFIQTYKCIIRADGKEYINSGVHLVIKTLGYAVKIVLAMCGTSVILLQAAYCVITILQVCFYRFYFTKHYSWVSFDRHVKGKLPDRNSYLITQLAWTIFSSTDMITLSLFISTMLSSVYTVYNLVFTSLSHLVNSVYNSVTYKLGQTFHKDLQQYTRLHDVYTSIFLGIITVMMCTAYVMCLPFVSLYTDGISDIDYIYEILPLLFCLVQMISWSRYVNGYLSGVAGYAKITSVVSIVEACTNITLSVILVQRFGIVGVLAATVVALPIKVIFLEWLAQKKVLHRSPLNYLRIILVNYGLFFAAVMINKKLMLPIHNYLQFFAYGALVFMVSLGFGIVVNLIANPDLTAMIRRKLHKR